VVHFVAEVRIIERLGIRERRVLRHRRRSGISHSVRLGTALRARRDLGARQTCATGDALEVLRVAHEAPSRARRSSRDPRHRISARETEEARRPIWPLSGENLVRLVPTSLILSASWKHSETGKSRTEADHLVASGTCDNLSRRSREVISPQNRRFRLTTGPSQHREFRSTHRPAVRPLPEAQITRCSRSASRASPQKMATICPRVDQRSPRWIRAPHHRRDGSGAGGIALLIAVRQALPDRPRAPAEHLRPGLPTRR
jgi:hypothetical protein